jgi:tetratricopeptide (TPR) repeat protein
MEEAYLLPALMLRDADRGAAALALLEDGFAHSAGPRLAEQLAFLALAEGDAGRALEVAETVLGSVPDRGDLLLARALALAALPDRSSEAPDGFERAFAAGVTHEGRARIEWARSLSDLERWPEAVAQLDAAAALLPGEAEVFFRLAAARRQLGDAEGARAALRLYQELNAARVAAERRVREIGTALNEAQDLAQENRLDDAAAILSTVVGGDSDPRVMMLRAKVLFSLHRVEEAVAAAARAQELAPNEVEPSYLRALFAFSDGRMSEALAAVERALVLEPGLGEAWALRGSALARSSRLDEAEESFQRALALGFDSVALRLDYAGVLSDLGRKEESRRQLEARDRLMGG